VQYGHHLPQQYTCHLALRSHVGSRTDYLLGTQEARTLGEQSNAKITEHDCVALVEQHILWFDITMDHLLFMRILQGKSDLPDIGHDDC